MGQPNLNQMMKQVQKMQADMAKAQEELKNEVVEASAGGGMVTVKISGELELKELRIDPEAVDPEDVEMLQDMVQAAVNEAIRSAQELAALEDERRRRRPGGPGGLGGPGHPRALGRASRSRLASVVLVRGTRQPAHHRARSPARHRAAHRAAAGLPHPQRLRGGGARARRRHPRGQGDGRPLRGLLQPRHRGHLPHLPGRAARAGHDLRGRAAQRRDPDRALRRVPRPLPRARRRAVADRRRRSRGPPRRPSCSAAWTTARASARW